MISALNLHLAGDAVSVLWSVCEKAGRQGELQRNGDTEVRGVDAANGNSKGVLNASVAFIGVKPGGQRRPKTRPNRLYAHDSAWGRCCQKLIAMAGQRPEPWHILS